MSDVLNSLLNASFVIGGSPILWREIIGNCFGLASAIGGMKRVVWAWPVGIIGNALLFTVFLGGVFHTPQNLDLYGQAGRQVMFLLVSIYGWWKWSQAKKKFQEPAGTDPNRSIFTEPHEDTAAVQPHWATTQQRIGLCVAGIVGTVGFALIFDAIGSWGPWADAWIFTGSILATIGVSLMATLRYDTPFTLVAVYMFVLGAGLGMVMQNLTLIVQNDTAPQQLGAASSNVNFFRTIAGTIGVTVMGSLLSTSVADFMKDGLKGFVPTTPDEISALERLGSGDVPKVGELPDTIRRYYARFCKEN